MDQFVNKSGQDTLVTDWIFCWLCIKTKQRYLMKDLDHRGLGCWSMTHMQDQQKRVEKEYKLEICNSGKLQV